MLLSLCIPTYNREKDVLKNVKKLIDIVEDNRFEDFVNIYVFDNCSTDNTQAEIEELIEKYQGKVEINYIKNSSNIGMTENIKKPIYCADAEYVMLLGDDDYICKEYLKSVVEYIRTGFSCIVPSYQNITPTGELMSRGRDIGKKRKEFKKGFKNCLHNMWRGHQMSGLVVKREELEKEMSKKGVNNPYPQVFMIGTSSMLGKTAHITEYPVLVTRPPQSKKTFSYGNDGYIGEFFDNFKLLSNISKTQRFLLETNFLYNQYWRYAMYIKKGPKAFLKCIASIEKSENTSIATKICFPIMLPFMLVIKAFVLLFSGKLFSVLKTKVDA